MNHEFLQIEAQDSRPPTRDSRLRTGRKGEDKVMLRLTSEKLGSRESICEPFRKFLGKQQQRPNEHLVLESYVCHLDC